MDDLSGKINELLSDPESMEKIKNLASMFSAQAGTNNNSNSQSQDQSNNNYNPLIDAFSNLAGNSNANYQNPQNNNPNQFGNSDDSFNIDPATIMKIAGAMRSMNGPDPRVDLLRALKENLSDKRQKKVDDAIKVMRLLSLMPLLQEQGIFNLFN